MEEVDIDQVEYAATDQTGSLHRLFLHMISTSNTPKTKWLLTKLNMLHNIKLYVYKEESCT